MKNLRNNKLILIIPVSIALVITAAFIFWPKSTGALNPNHECAMCHNAHMASGQALTNSAVANDVCLSCHDPSAPTPPTLKATVHSGTKYGAFEMGCVDCHNPHDNVTNWRGTTNIKMIGSDLDGYTGTITTPNSGVQDVVFTSRGTDAGEASLYSFADGDEDSDGTYDNICEICHTQTDHHRNSTSGGDHTHYVGQTCTDCHPHDENFAPAGGGTCTGCHGSATDRNDGPPTRRAITGEFSLTSHHVAAGAVTSDDCAVCHMEGVDMTTYHWNNAVDLRDPDTGGAITSFAQFSRDTASSTLETWVTNVQNNLCLKCHDADGATASNFSGDPMRPFSSGARDVPNVYAQFDTANAYHHAVRGTVGNPFCNSATLEAPWDSGGPHVISCFDCHGTSGHGGSNQRMLRTSIDLDTMEATIDKASLPAGMGLTVETFCTLCHKSTEYVDGSANSKFEYHGGNMSQHSGASNELGCLGCHGGIVNLSEVTNGAARGNLHGGNYTWPSGTWSVGASSQFFMVGGWISGWKPNTSAGNNGCGGGSCNHPGSTKRNEPGKEYTIVAD